MSWCLLPFFIDEESTASNTDTGDVGPEPNLCSAVCSSHWRHLLVRERILVATCGSEWRDAAVAHVNVMDPINNITIRYDYYFSL